MEAQSTARNNHDEIVIDYDDILDDGSEGTYASSSRLDLGSEEKQILMRKGLVNVEQESTEFKLVKKSFLKGMEYMEQVTDLIAVHKNNVSSDLGRQARSDSFRIFSQAVAKSCGGKADLRHAWYGGSLDELLEIVSTGFSICRISNSSQDGDGDGDGDDDGDGDGDDIDDDDSHGVGIHLFPAKFSLDAAMSTVAKEDGSRHMLLCRVILGRAEAVPAGSKQSQPSSVHYNSGVDNISTPRKYIIWTAFMNSHIHPDYILSFKFTPSADCPLISKPSYPLLLAKLSKHLEPSQMALLAKGYRQCQEQKITKRQWLKKMKKIIGNNLLVLMIRN